MKYTRLLFFFSMLMSPPAIEYSIAQRSGQKRNDIRHIPVLCYHNIRLAPKKQDIFFISSVAFDHQMALLHDSGYKSILPSQIVAYYLYGVTLPSKPVMISFDDSHEEHFSIAAPILNRYGFKAVFFVMTICINKPGYLNDIQIRELNRQGHIIGAHTREHYNLTKLPAFEWSNEVERPAKILESITGSTVNFLAYPFGVWNEEVLKETVKSGFSGGFQLNGRSNDEFPLFTIRRMMVPGNLQGPSLIRLINSVFK